MRSGMWTLSVLAVIMLTVAAPGTIGRAQETVQDDVNGTCPSGFTLVVVTNHPKDKNSNGKICRTASAQKDKAGAQSNAPRVVDDINGTCPPDYFLKTTESRLSVDKNGNGKICVRR